jgi:hypothetical protein
MKRIFYSALAALGLLALPQARAWTYSDGDALLIFRDGTHDVEFDLGNVSQFTGQTNGYTLSVTNWNFNLVTNTFGTDLTTNGDGVTVLLVASTSSETWLSGTEPNTTAYSQSASALGSVYGIVFNVGHYPGIYNVPTNSVPQSYSLAVSGSSSTAAGRYKYASYDYIVSGGTYEGVPRLGNNAPFIDEQNIPGNLDFWATTAAQSATPTPDHLVGTFSITTNGVLTFVAGPRASNIIGVTRSGNVSTVQFTTTVGNTYSVAYTNQLGAPIATWPLDGNTLIGDGNNDVINHTNSGAAAEFYRVTTQ